MGRDLSVATAPAAPFFSVTAEVASTGRPLRRRKDAEHAVVWLMRWDGLVVAARVS